MMCVGKLAASANQNDFTAQAQRAAPMPGMVWPLEPRSNADHRSVYSSAITPGFTGVIILVEPVLAFSISMGVLLRLGLCRQRRRMFRNFLGLRCTERLHALPHRQVGDTDHPCGIQRRIDGTGLAHASKRNRGPRRHFGHGQYSHQFIHLALSRHGNADYGQVGTRGGITLECSRKAGTTDDDLVALFLCTAHELLHSCWGTMRRRNMRRVGQRKILERNTGMLHDGPVAFRTHDHADAPRAQVGRSCMTQRDSPFLSTGYWETSAGHIISALGRVQVLLATTRLFI